MWGHIGCGAEVSPHQTLHCSSKQLGGKWRVFEIIACDVALSFQPSGQPDAHVYWWDKISLFRFSTISKSWRTACLWHLELSLGNWEPHVSTFPPLQYNEIMLSQKPCPESGTALDMTDVTGESLLTAWHMFYYVHNSMSFPCFHKGWCAIIARWGHVPIWFCRLD